MGDQPALQLPDAIALGLILVGCCPGGVSSNIMSYLCGGDVAFSVGMTTVSTLLSPIMTPLLVAFLASGTKITIEGLPMFVSIIETGHSSDCSWIFPELCMGEEESIPGIAEGNAGNRSAGTCLRGRGRNFLSGSELLYFRRRHLCGSAAS